MNKAMRKRERRNKSFHKKQLFVFTKTNSFSTPDINTRLIAFSSGGISFVINTLLHQASGALDEG
ncbi:hypothetical protein [Mucilaginibacter sp. FT3.2]|uniref:hypothetical protein n=1 Tax=Mucilaginibacter sp. FT3.2 TaxID=2723090 RepID=UPI00160B3977|nr:hypothetical protein [Mucilaginibacter sp. FT3.2]MBB6235365.1 hypothetical protein [Mucilaginibacter sp. FT3.2]